MITIKQAKEIREMLKLTHIVIFGVTEDNNNVVATHGLSVQQGKEAAQYGNQLKKALGWPLQLCKSTPMKRICDNCSFWKIRNYDHSERIPHNFEGNCYYSPSLIKRVDNDIACSNFEPKC